MTTDLLDPSINQTLFSVVGFFHLQLPKAAYSAVLKGGRQSFKAIVMGLFVGGSALEWPAYVKLNNKSNKRPHQNQMAKIHWLVRWATLSIQQMPTNEQGHNHIWYTKISS